MELLGSPCAEPSRDTGSPYHAPPSKRKQPADAGPPAAAPTAEANETYTSDQQSLLLNMHADLFQ
eukprot:7204921-Heterocapsa_arctica.AAC.1